LEPIAALKEFLQTHPAPWLVGMWTVPKDGSSPDEYTAGYFGLKAESVHFLEGMVHLTAKDDIAGLSLAENAIGPVESVREGVIKFTYHNILAAPEDFYKPLVVVVEKTAE